MRRILPIERSTPSGSTTSTATVTPMPPLTSSASAAPAFGGVGRGRLRAALDLDGERVQAAVAAEHALEVRRQLRRAQDELLDLGGEDVHPAHDHHVVGAAGDLLHPAHRPGGAGQQPGEVAGAVADDRHRLLGQRGEDQLAERAVRQHLAGHRVDDLRVEVVLPDVQAVLGLHALVGHAGAHHLGQPVDVDGVRCPGAARSRGACPRSTARRRRCPPAATSCAGRCPGAPSRRRSPACSSA